MSTLMIKDLSATIELDASAMASVRGGYYKGAPAYCMPSFCTPS